MHLTLHITLTGSNDVRLKLIHEYCEKSGCTAEQLGYEPNQNPIKLDFDLVLIHKKKGISLLRNLLIVLSHPDKKQIEANLMVYANDGDDYNKLIVSTLIVNNYKSTMTFPKNNDEINPAVHFNNVFGIPASNPSFSRRSSELNILAEVSKKIRLITGFVGAGKTELARQHALEMLTLNKSDSSKGYQSVIWIQADRGVNCEDRQNNMLMQFQELGRCFNLSLTELTPSNLLRLIYKRLDEKHAPCLIIFDGVDNYRSIGNLLPPSNVHCMTLVTTRNHNDREFSSSWNQMVLDQPIKYSDEDKLCSTTDTESERPESIQSRVAQCCNLIMQENLESYKVLKVCSLISEVQKTSEIELALLKNVMKTSMIDLRSALSTLRRYGLISNSKLKTGFINLFQPANMIAALVVTEKERPELMRVIEESLNRSTTQELSVTNQSRLFMQASEPPVLNSPLLPLEPQVGSIENDPEDSGYTFN